MGSIVLENTPVEAPEIRPESARVRRRKTRLRSVAELDLRTVSGKRARALARLFESALGQVSPAQRLAIDGAAGLVALSEDAVARRLRGEAVPLDDVIRAVACARRAVRDLGIDRKREPAVPSLAEYLAKREAAE
jgi:hypothetical protein